MKRERATSFRTELVEHIPRQIDPGVLYVSRKYGTANHLCACGCGEQTNTPIRPYWADGWSLEIDESTSLATLSPSIGNFQIACRSHYFIQRGQAVWA